MKFFQIISLATFMTFVLFSVFFSYLVNVQIIEISEKPWHMQPSVDADSLSDEYVDKYELLDKMALKRNDDPSRTQVVILVDAWGVPFDEKLLAKDFSVFEGLTHEVFLHHRLANRTRHAEFVELRRDKKGGIYLFGGDSLEYGRNLYIDSLGYTKKLFCQKCVDSVMFNKLDSLLSLDSLFASEETRLVAMTTQDSRDGDRAKLHTTLRDIVATARRHPGVRFIVQGTHRPILGDPKIRRECFSRWVPAVIIE